MPTITVPIGPVRLDGKNGLRTADSTTHNRNDVVCSLIELDNLGSVSGLLTPLKVGGPLQQGIFCRVPDDDMYNGKLIRLFRCTSNKRRNP